MARRGLGTDLYQIPADSWGLEGILSFSFAMVQGKEEINPSGKGSWKGKLVALREGDLQCGSLLLKGAVPFGEGG